jgi:hypothetical protein
MAEAPVPDRPNIHSNRVPVAAKWFGYVCFFGFQHNPDKADGALDSTLPSPSKNVTLT